MKTLAVILVTILLAFGMLTSISAFDQEHLDEMQDEFGIDFSSRTSVETVIEKEALPSLAEKPAEIISDVVEPKEEKKPVQKTASENKIVVTEVTQADKSPSSPEQTKNPSDQVSDKVESESIERERNRPDKIAMMSAIESDDGAAGGTSDDGITGGNILSMAVKLLIVLALAYVTIMGLKWISGGRNLMSQSSSNLKVTDSVRLSPSASLHIVNVKGKTLLIGSSGSQVNMLQEVEGEEFEGEIPQTNSKFSEYLEKYSTTGKTDSPASRVAGLLRDCTDYLRQKQSHISNVKKLNIGESDVPRRNL